jgi:serine/threonine-protein kinase
VILYELLTGHRPYQITGHSLPELTRVVCEVEPTRPSQMVERQEEILESDGTSRKVSPETVSRTRGDSADKLRRRLSGDLDNIVMSALRKEPQRRYASVEQLSEDIRRHLEGRPVRARKSTLAYRGSKFARRHRTALAAVVLVMVSLVGFTIVTARARARAEREAVKAQAINDFMQKTLATADPFTGVGREVTVVEALGKAVQELESSFSNEAEVRAAIQRTIGKTYLELGRFEEAQPLLVSALETRRALFGEVHPDVADSLQDLAYLKLDRGEFAEAGRLYREALRMHRELPGQESQVAVDLNGLAMVLFEMGDFEAAEPFQREALELRRELDGEEGRLFSTVLNDLAIILEAKGEFEEAEDLYRRSLAIDRKLFGDEHPDVATTTNNLGLLLADAKGSEAAEPLFREALAIRRKVLGEHPDTAVSLSVLGQILSEKGDTAGAEQVYREALAMQRRLLGNEHTELTSTLNNLARVLGKAGKYEEAETLYREAIAIWRQEMGDSHPDLGVNISNLARMLADKGDTAEAEALHQEACSIILKVHGDDHWMSAYCGSLYGAFLTRLARYEEAEALLLGSYPVLRDTLAPKHVRTERALNHLVDLYDAWEKPEKAAEFRALLPDADAPEG